MNKPFLAEEILKPSTRNKWTLRVTSALVEALAANDYLVVDVEADGLADATKIWIISIYDPSTNTSESYVPWDVADEFGHKMQHYRGNLSAAFDRMRGRYCVLHNGLKYDIPLIQRLHPDCGLDYTKIIDTLVLSKLGDPTKKGGHSLEAWGARIGMQKQEHDEWDRFSLEMETRCTSDTVITDRVLHKFMPSKDACIFAVMPMAVEIEHSVAWQVGRVERTGFKLNVALAERWLIEFTAAFQDTLRQLREHMPTRMVPAQKKQPVKVLKTINKRHPMYGQLDPDTPFCPVVAEEFTGSRDQAADRLRKKYGWKPKAFTSSAEGAQPIMSEETLGDLPYPEAPLLIKYYELEKKIAFLKSKDNKKIPTGWLDLVHPDGRVYCSIDANRAYTHRMASAKPNLMQVGLDLREVWEAAEGWVLVGVDAKSLEARTLAHFIARVDGGAWAHQVISGDIHAENKEKLGLWVRDTAKRIVYALPYGAGAFKLAQLWLHEDKKQYELEKLRAGVSDFTPWTPNYSALGLAEGCTKKSIGEAIAAKLDGICRIKKDAASSVRQRGWLPGLDGRKIRSARDHAYSALATLNQGAGAIVMKAAIYLCPAVFEWYGLEYGVDYRVVMYIHDEFQIEARPDKAELVKEAGIQAIALTTQLLKLRCPMDGDGKIGKTWKETH